MSNLFHFQPSFYIVIGKYVVVTSHTIHGLVSNFALQLEFMHRTIEQMNLVICKWFFLHISRIPNTFELRFHGVQCAIYCFPDFHFIFAFVLLVWKLVAFHNVIYSWISIYWSRSHAIRSKIFTKSFINSDRSDLGQNLKEWYRIDNETCE